MPIDLHGGSLPPLDRGLAFQVVHHGELCLSLLEPKILPLWIVLQLLISSCLSSQGDQQGSPAQAGVKAKNAGASTDNVDEDDLPGLPFPKKSTRHSTKMLLLAYPQPGLSKIHSCIEQIKVQAEQAASQEDMVVAKNMLIDLIDHERPVYHYCFFHIVAKLDQRLDEGGPVIETLAPIFLETMRGLWILASALDAPLGTDRYFNYLKARYVQLSQDAFGRPMETIGPPMGNLRFDPEKLETKTTGSAAAAAPTTVASPLPLVSPNKKTSKKPPKIKTSKKSQK